MEAKVGVLMYPDFLTGYHTTSLDNWKQIQKDGYLYPSLIKRIRVSKHHAFHIPNFIRQICYPFRKSYFFRRQHYIPRLKSKIVYHNLKLSYFTDKTKAVWVFVKPPVDQRDLKYRILFNLMRAPTDCMTVVNLKIKYPVDFSLTQIADNAGDILNLMHTGTGDITLDDDQTISVDNVGHHIRFDLITEPVPIENISVDALWTINIC